MRQELEDFAQARRDELVELVSQLVAAKTENPPGNEHLAAAVVADHLRRLGIPYRTWEAEKGRTNIIGRIGQGRPRVLVAAHLDVVPAGEDWQTDPYRVVVRDGYMYGRGTCDNKGAMASMLIAGEYLKRIEDQLRGEVWLAGVADEELGSRLGVKYLLDQDALDVDYALVPDVADHMRVIDVAEKGALFLELVSHGKQAHGSRPDQGVNAIWNMIQLLRIIRDARIPSADHRLLSPPTLNLGRIEGGSAPNMVPGRCRASIDIRYLPGTTAEEIIALVQSAVDQAQRETGGRFEMREIMNQPPTELREDHPLVRALAEATEEVTGFEPKVGGMSGATVVKQLLLADIAAVGCGAGEPGMAHASNERAPIGELLDFSRVIVLTCLKLMQSPA